MHYLRNISILLSLPFLIITGYLGYIQFTQYVLIILPLIGALIYLGMTIPQSTTLSYQIKEIGALKYIFGLYLAQAPIPIIIYYIAYFIGK